MSCNDYTLLIYKATCTRNFTHYTHKLLLHLIWYKTFFLLCYAGNGNNIGGMNTNGATRPQVFGAEKRPATIVTVAVRVITPVEVDGQATSSHTVTPLVQIGHKTGFSLRGLHNASSSWTMQCDIKWFFPEEQFCRYHCSSVFGVWLISSSTIWVRYCNLMSVVRWRFQNTPHQR